MAYAHAERLSALDESFLALEDARCHMHIGAVAIFDAGPLATPDGGIDVDRVRALMAAGIHRIPRYRQRLAWSPIFNHPAWVDDDRFNLAYHVRHTHLPRPGDARQLKRLVGRLMSQALDRGKPLWEMWVVEGLEGDRFAIVTKVHHCMIDGVGSVDLMGAVMRTTPDPDPALAQPPPQWIPRPAPEGFDLFFRELSHRAATPLEVARLVRDGLRAPRETADRVIGAVAGLCEALSAGARPASPTALNVAIGPHRRFDWLRMDMTQVRAVKAALGGTLNDVVLATLSGALRHFLRRRGVDVDRLDFRAMVPVNVRSTGERLGNRVAMVSVTLPLDIADARARLARVVARTTVVKQSHQALGVQTLEEIADRTLTTLFIQFARMASIAQPYNVVVTNVPGPAFPVYVQGARMLECYPVVPLFECQGLGVALFSYDGGLHWGFNADWDVVPDLHDLVQAVESEFETLAAGA